MIRTGALEAMAEEFYRLDDQKKSLDRQSREIEKALKDIRQSLQDMVGVAEEIGIPHVTRIGNYCITQIKKHREVQAYEYDYIEFKVIESPTKP
jgi:chaperonin cofactor prefoldin